MMIQNPVQMLTAGIVYWGFNARIIKISGLICR